jgi:hypothetical protein
VKLATDSFCKQCGLPLQSSQASAGNAEPLVSAATAALVIWLVSALFFNYSLAFKMQGLQLETLYSAILGNGAESLLVLLAIIGIGVHYYYAGQDTLFPRGWGPLAALSAVVLVSFEDATFYAFGGPVSNWYLLLFVIFWNVVLVALALPEYRRETRPPHAQREPEQKQSQRGRASLAVRRRVDELRVRSRLTQQRIGRDLTALIVAMPVIFFEPVFLQIVGGLPIIFVDSVWVLFAVFFVVLALRLRSSLKRSRFAIIDVNRPQVSASGQVRLQGERGQQALFLAVYVVTASYLIQEVVRNLGQFSSSGTLFVTLGFLYLLAALLCFLVGSLAFRGSPLGEIHLTEPSAADELGEGTGVVPVKVQRGETHSLMMEFDIVGPAVKNGTSSAGRYYELYAQGIDDADKRRASCEAPATLMAMWNCQFCTAGNQAINIVLDAAIPPEGPNATAQAKRETLFAHSHNVAVESLLTASAENALALVSVSVSTICIAVSIVGLVGLPAILHVF